MREQIIALVERYVSREWRPSGGENLMMPCPFHETQDGRPFSVNVEKGLFRCFSCHVSGTIAAMLERLKVPRAVIEAETAGLKDLLDQHRRRRELEKKASWYYHDPLAVQTPISPALLSVYDWMPTSLVNDGFLPETLRACRVGYDQNQMRITYPVFDLYGQLAGVVGGRSLAGQDPKYLVYQGRRKAPDGRVIESEYGTWFHENYPDYTFKNHDHLWGYEAVYPLAFHGKEVLTLIVVEGFKARLWLLQHGYLLTVALMGSRMSERQKQLLERPRANKILFYDNDDAGREGMLTDGGALYRQDPGVWVARYPPDAWGCQPDHLRSQSALHQAIAGAMRYPDYVKEVRS